MRVSVVQMNPGADKAENIAQARRLIDAAVEADRPDIVSAAGGLDLPRRRPRRQVRQAEVLPADRLQRTRRPGLRVPARASPAARAPRAWRLDRRERAARRCSTPPWCSTPTGTRSPATARSTCSTSSPPTAPATAKAAPTAPATRSSPTRPTASRSGCAICYDLRFPELFLALRRAGAELIFLPSAFTLQTGKDHWEVLIRARAIETQCWFAAPATWGKHLDGERRARASPTATR